MNPLFVAPCSYEAASYSVTRWHYSGTLPRGRLVRLGVWEHDAFIGCVIFSRGATNALGAPWGLTNIEAAELTRVALSTHAAPVSRIVSVALGQLRSTSPGLRLVVSFADPAHGHHGGIYQAGNWIYTGRSADSQEWRVFGRQLHGRLLSHKGWVRNVDWLRANVDPHAERIIVAGKHRYVMPLDRATRRRVARYARPYPPAVEASEVTRPVSDRERQVQSPPTALH